MTRTTRVLVVVLALGAAAAAPASAAAADPVLHAPPSQAFGAWLAACDNFGDCTAYGFGAGDSPVTVPATMIVSLPRGAPPTITVVLQPDTDRASSVRLPNVRLQSSRRGPAATIPLNPSGPGTLRGTLSAGEVAVLLPTLRPAGRLVLSQPAPRGGRSTTLGVIPLAGAAAALDWIAARQRALPETRSAPPPPSSTAPPPSFEGPQYDPRHLPRRVAALPAVRACQREDAGDAPGADGAGVAVWQLSAAVSLWSFPCGSGNFDRATLFVLDGPHGSAAPASFTTLMQMAPHPPGLLVNAEPAPDGRELAATAPSRGLGDCGDFRNYRWDGTRFRLVLARLMTACRGLPVEDWPVVYRSPR